MPFSLSQSRLSLTSVLKPINAYIREALCFMYQKGRVLRRSRTASRGNGDAMGYRLQRFSRIRYRK
jgi:hypothetical protein